MYGTTPPHGNFTLRLRVANEQVASAFSHADLQDCSKPLSALARAQGLIKFTGVLLLVA
jgi:hypothetical protein